MALFDKTFVRTLRPHVRRAIEASPPLREEYRRSKKGWRHNHLPPWLVRLVIGVFWTLMFLNWTKEAGTIAWALTALTFWMAGASLSIAGKLRDTLFESKDLLVYYHLPFEDHQVFEYQWRKHLRLLAPLVANYALLYAWLGWRAASHPSGVASGLLLGVAQAGLVFALACWALRWVPPLLAMVMATSLFGSAVTVLYFKVFVASWQHDLGSAALVLPPGWVNFVFLRAVAQGDWLSWSVLIPVLLLIVTSVYSKRRLAAEYELAEMVVPAGSPDDEDDTSEVAASADSFVFTHRGITSIEDSVAQREFLQSEPWRNAGWMEQLIARWFSPREHVVADFLIGRSLGATVSWLRSIKIAVVAAIVIWFFGHYNVWVIYLSLFFAGIMSLPLLDGGNRGMTMCFLGSGYSPAFAPYPITAREIMRTIWKVNFVRCALALPIATFLGAISGTKFSMGPEGGALFGIKAWALALALQPVFLIFRLSNGTNDSERVRLVNLIVACPLVLILMGSIAVFIVASVAWQSLAGFVAIIAVSKLLSVLYRRAFDRSRFDLVRRSSGT